MSDLMAPRIEVKVGDVSGSQLVFGDHNTIQTPKGARVTVLQVGEHPTPRLRALPLEHCPPLRVAVLGREAELSLAASALPESPFEVYGPDGIGKTVLLKGVAHGPLRPREGVIFESARRRTLDEILTSLYSACWECDVPFIPTPAQVGEFLVDRQALVVIDDCELDRGDLDALLDKSPHCTFVIGSNERTLWSCGVAEQLGGLGQDAAVEMLERQLGGFDASADRSAAEVLARRLDGHPQRLVEAAALVAGHKVRLQELADDGAGLVSELGAAAVTPDDRRILALLGVLEGATLGTAHVAAVSDVPDAEARLAALEQQGWIKSASPRYALVRTPAEDDGELRGRLGASLLEHLVTFAEREINASAVSEEAEAIEAALRFAARRGHWPQVLALALASESKLASSGAWIKWRRVLVRGLEAARLAADRSSEAHMLHQLGSLALCLGAVDEAAVQLAEALHIREGLGDEMGAELTRHNLRQIRGAPTPEAHGPDRPADPPAKKRQWPFPKMTLLILALVIVLVLVVVLIALSGGGSRSASTVRALPTPNVTAPNQIQTATVASPTTETSTSTSTSTTTVVVPAPTVTISSPKDRSRVAQGSSLNAEFSCTPSGASCDATDANGQPVALGQPLDTETPGLHTLTVTASAQGVQPATRSATYSVFTTGTQDGTTPTPVNPGLLPTVPSTPPPPSPVG